MQPVLVALHTLDENTKFVKFSLSKAIQQQVEVFSGLKCLYLCFQSIEDNCNFRHWLLTGSCCETRPECSGELRNRTPSVQSVLTWPTTQGEIIQKSLKWVMSS